MTQILLQTLLDEICKAPGIPVIMGPTAVGKSELAILAAKRMNGEIISADSMQFYRGLDIGTAKPTAEEQLQVPHHLIDSMDIREKSDIYRFRSEAIEHIKEIRFRGKCPILAGGSGLYLRALIYGLDSLPADATIRKELDRAYDNPDRFCELQAIMQRDCPNDFLRFGEHRRKLIRSREVYLLTGHQMTELQTGFDVPDPMFSQFVLVRNRADLVDRIRIRTLSMLKNGWIEEARTLIAEGLLQTPTAWQAIGYAQIHAFLTGQKSDSELIESILIATRQYARRQTTWFRTQHKHAVFLSLS